MLGPSGCGKTTTLRMIAGLELPTHGRILLDGEDVTFLRASHRDIAFVFQMFALYPHLSVFRNIAYPLRSQGVPRAEVRERVRGDGTAAAHRAPAQARRVGAVRRGPAARGAGPRDRATAEGVPDGRAARRAGCRVPPADVRRAAAAARPHRRDHGLRHARPARGHGDGRSHRGDEPGRGGAGRHAAGDLRPAGQHVRGRLHRLAADELSALRGRGTPGRAHGPNQRRHAGRAGAARGGGGPARARAAARACPLADDSPLRGRVFGAEYLGTTQIVTRQHPARPDQGAAALVGAGRRRRQRRTRVAHRAAAAVRCRSGRALRSALHDGEVDG